MKFRLVPSRFAWPTASFCMAMVGAFTAFATAAKYAGALGWEAAMTGEISFIDGGAAAIIVATCAMLVGLEITGCAGLATFQESPVGLGGLRATRNAPCRLAQISPEFGAGLA